MHVEQHETEASQWEVARRRALPSLEPYLLAPPEGWTQMRGSELRLREVPFPGIPLILNLGAPWDVEDIGGSGGVHRRDSFLAGLHTMPAVVRGSADWSCIELRLTPLGAYRLFRLPMHELVNASLELAELLPETRELTARLREAQSWMDRFDLVEAFLTRRFADAPTPPPGVDWSWQWLRRTHGRAPISALAAELGWSHRRLIARFREQIGLTPKMLARVIRFDRAVTSLRSSAGRDLAEIAFDCGYFDQAHLNRDFRQFAGTSPTAFRAAQLESGGIAA